MPASQPASADEPLSAEAIDAALNAQSDYERLESHFQATIEKLPIGIANADLEDRITRVTRPARELLGHRFAEITYPDDVDGSAMALDRLLRGEVNGYSIEKRYIKKDGSVVWAHVTVAPSHDVHGQLDGAIGILKDITAGKAAESEVERIHKDL